MTLIARNPTDAERSVPPGVTVVSAVVEHGDERGRELGFPTANLSVDGALDGSTLEDGVWAGWLRRADGSLHVAAISVGGRPTFYGPDGFRLVEAHVLDFCDDLYDEEVQLYVCHKLRRQRRFRSLEALISQLERDVAACRRWAGDQRLDHVRTE